MEEVCKTCNGTKLVAKYEGSDELVQCPDCIVEPKAGKEKVKKEKEEVEEPEKEVKAGKEE